MRDLLAVLRVLLGFLERVLDGAMGMVLAWALLLIGDPKAAYRLARRMARQAHGEVERREQQR